MNAPTERGLSSWVICGSPISLSRVWRPPSASARSPAARWLETLTDALRPRRLLLTLDNCEHLIDACARLCQRLLASSPGLRVIATSREPLHVAAETVWQVQPLSVAPDGAAAAPEDAFRYEAIRLFVTGPPRRFPVSPLPRPTRRPSRRSAARWTGCRWRSSWQPPGSGRCRWSRSPRGWPTASGCSPPATGPRHLASAPCAPRWTGATSCSRASEQVLLRRLSVFVGWSLEMAEQVCSDDDIPASDVLDLLDSPWWTSRWWCVSPRCSARRATG